MNKIGEYKEKIIRCLDDLVRFTNFSNKAGRFDLNKDAEEFYRGLLNLFFGWNLKNANTEKDPNAEGVDLLFLDEKIAIQVTSENDSEKVHKSIIGFKNKALQAGYEELYILMFKGKKDFPRVDFAKTVGGTFTFDKTKHIIDHSDLCSKLENAEFESFIEPIYNYLERTVGLSYSGVDESIDDLGIINEVFEYVQQNRPKKATITLSMSVGVDLIPKIRLNFPVEQQDAVERLMKKTWDKKETVGKFIENQVQEDEISVIELIVQIQDDFCTLRRSNKPDAKIEDIEIIRNLSLNYLPNSRKKHLGYIANSEALVFYFFELCYIGDKTEKQQNHQGTLFD